jgi:hypothetical protein
MTDDTPTITNLPSASSYIRPSDPTTVLDVDWGLLAETLERLVT